MNLIQLQKKFPLLLAHFYLDLDSMGYEITLGDSYRSPECAKYYADKGTGIVRSLHCDRLAQDLNLFFDGKFLTTVVDYQEAGGLWESYSTDDYTCSWGGRFQDADHFSLAWQGRR